MAIAIANFHQITTINFRQIATIVFTIITPLGFDFIGFATIHHCLSFLPSGVFFSQYLAH